MEYFKENGFFVTNVYIVVFPFPISVFALLKGILECLTVNKRVDEELFEVQGDQV